MSKLTEGGDVWRVVEIFEEISLVYLENEMYVMVNLENSID